MIAVREKLVEVKKGTLMPPGKVSSPGSASFYSAR